VKLPEALLSQRQLPIENIPLKSSHWKGFDNLPPFVENIGISEKVHGKDNNKERGHCF
jgi:hypothetical protein